MWRVRCFFSGLMIIGILFTAAYPVHSLGLGIGATAWYSWWNPQPKERDAEADPDFLYGPQLVLQFTPALSLSTAFLYGKFHYTSNDGFSSDIARYDSDTTMVYALNRYVRLFGGLKFMGYDYEGGSHRAAGPGMGFGFVFPVTDAMFFSMAFSGIYLWGKQEDDGGNYDFNFIEYGLNSSANISYAISPSVNIAVGGRFFFFEFEAADDDITYGSEKHYFYGITASAMYMIQP